MPVRRRTRARHCQCRLSVQRVLPDFQTQSRGIRQESQENTAGAAESGYRGNWESGALGLDVSWHRFPSTAISCRPSTFPPSPSLPLSPPSSAMLSYKPMEPVQFRLAGEHPEATAEPDDEHLHLITSSGRTLRAAPGQLPAPHELTPEPSPIPTPALSEDSPQEEDPATHAQSIRDAIARRDNLLANDTAHTENGHLAPPNGTTPHAHTVSTRPRLPSYDDRYAYAYARLAYAIQIILLYSPRIFSSPHRCQTPPPAHRSFRSRQQLPPNRRLSPTTTSSQISQTSNTNSRTPRRNLQRLLFRLPLRLLHHNLTTPLPL